MATGADRRTVNGMPRAQWAQAFVTRARRRRTTTSRWQGVDDLPPA